MALISPAFLQVERELSASQENKLSIRYLLYFIVNIINRFVIIETKNLQWHIFYSIASSIDYSLVFVFWRF